MALPLVWVSELDVWSRSPVVVTGRTQADLTTADHRPPPTPPGGNYYSERRSHSMEEDFFEDDVDDYDDFFYDPPYVAPALPVRRTRRRFSSQTTSRRPAAIVCGTISQEAASRLPPPWTMKILKLKRWYCNTLKINAVDRVVNKKQDGNNNGNM
ncbi:hypothetical protein IV203_000798 [Nitzschia inconspicua]|uniref:Uncharacterized protein n=1 Tax=Nitzschia inconspicua TaxID=303405 RepID=A0A9K3PQJ8_9STRA|nr:hypothetical protein IV203_000798 [Nitzschia inconspicua]